MCDYCGKLSFRDSAEERYEKRIRALIAELRSEAPMSLVYRSSVAEALEQILICEEEHIESLVEARKDLRERLREMAKASTPDNIF